MLSKVTAVHRTAQAIEVNPLYQNTDALRMSAEHLPYAVLAMSLLKTVVRAVP
jgi:hypothetical protein